MTFVNDLTNFVSWATSPFWNCCRQKKVEVLEPSPIDTSWAQLKVGDQFSYHGKSFHVASTTGDGACGLHALLGVKSATGSYTYPTGGGEARKDYCEALVKNATLTTFIGFLADRLNDSITPQQTTGGGLDASSSDNALTKRIAKMDSKRWFSSFRSGTLDQLKAKITSLEQEVAKEKRSAQDIQKVLLEYAQLPAVQKAYFEVCLDRSYYFSPQELGIAGELFDKKVTVFIDRLPHSPQVYNPNGQQEVFIYLGGNHFSHLEVS